MIDQHLIDRLAALETEQALDIQRDGIETQPYAGGVLSIAPESDGEYPSQNANKIRHCGSLREPTVDELVSLTRSYAEMGLPRLFAYVPPHRNASKTVLLLEEAGFRPVVEESVLVTTPEHGEPDDVRESKDEDEIARVLRAGFETESVDNIVATLRHPATSVFIADCNGEPAACGALTVRNGLAYLGWGCTARAYRGNGLHQKLIRSRVSRAAGLGCDTACSVTYDFIPSSYTNLLRCGFHESHRVRIYGWENPQIIGERGRTVQ